MIWILKLVFYSTQIGKLLIWVIDHSYPYSSFLWSCRANSEASMSWGFSSHRVIMAEPETGHFNIHSQFPIWGDKLEKQRCTVLIIAGPLDNCQVPSPVSRLLVLWEKCLPTYSGHSVANFPMFAAANKLTWLLLDTFGPQMSHWIERESFIWQ